MAPAAPGSQQDPDGPDLNRAVLILPSRVGSPAGRGAPAPPQSFKSRSAGRSESSGAAAATPSQVKGCGQAHRHGAIPGARVPRFSGSLRLPAGLPRPAPYARGPGVEPAHGPGQQAHQPQPPARQAASSSSSPEATPASQKGSLHRLVVLRRWFPKVELELKSIGSLKVVELKKLFKDRVLTLGIRAKKVDIQIALRAFQEVRRMQTATQE
ncbi:hypothetical protein NDU88_003087 [Pleurodeles waltl]|uniref:Uncharacterized protein n=1 Tax=Pleurodeles waltl TaxID=8319 RepID=A0AAV7NJR8_PLEWA|nr:hypothetical protein NDU88_003087 [Pleurodeles waltl]